MSTPSPYLRDRLLQAADGLRKDAETARLNVAAADQDVAAALALLEEARQVLAEAEAHRDAQRAKVDTLAEEIAWVEERAAERTPPAYDPDAALAATGLMPREAAEREKAGREISRLRWGVAEPAQVPHPVKLADQPEHTGPVSATLYQDNGLPMVWSSLDPPGGYVCAMPHGPNSFGVVLPDGTRVCGMPVESEPCDLHGQPDDFAGNGKPVNGDDLPFNVVQAPADVVAALTGGTRVITDEPPTVHTVYSIGTGAGQVVATSGPTQTMPDTGLAPAPLEPAQEGDGPRHRAPARPGLLARLTGGHRIVPEQNGDDRG